MEVGLVYAIVFIIIPSFFFGGIVGYLRYRRLGAGILLGLFFAIIVAPLVVIIIIKVEINTDKNKLINDSAYLKSSLIGEYTDNEIRNHYNRYPLRNINKQYFWIDSILNDDSFKAKPTTKRIILLSEISAKEVEIVERLALLPNAPNSLKLSITNTKSSYIANKIANDLNSTSELLIELAAHQSNIETENLILKHPNASQMVLDIITINRSNRGENSTELDRYKEAKPTVKCVSSSKKAAWKYLANHKDPGIVHNIAKSQETPLDLLDFIAANNSNDVVMASVFLNKHTSQYAKKLIQERFPNITNFVLSETTNPISSIKSEISVYQDVTPQMLENLMKYQYYDAACFREIAKNPNVTSEILTKLSTRSIPGVQKLVAQNSKTPRSVLNELSNNADVEVATAAKLNLVKTKQEMP